MPIYEYACQKCNHAFEALQKVSEGPLRKCPECGALQLKRLVSAPQFRLKGTGWYETDFKKDGKKRLAEGAEAAPVAAADSADKADSGGKADKPDKADKAAKPEKSAEPAPAKASKPAAGAATTD